MISLARRLAADEGLSNAWFDQADAQIYHFPKVRSTWQSRGPGPCSSADRRRRSPTSPAPSTVGRLALLSWQPRPTNEWVSELTGALAAGRDLPRLLPKRPGRSPLPTLAGCASYWPAPGSPASRSIRSRPRCGSAPTPRTPTGTRSGLGLDARRPRRGPPRPNARRPASHDHRSQHSRGRRLQIRCLADPGTASLGAGRLTGGGEAPGAKFSAAPDDAQCGEQGGGDREGASRGR
jgi:hypothetical protein